MRAGRNVSCRFTLPCSVANVSRDAAPWLRLVCGHADCVRWAPTVAVIKYRRKEAQWKRDDPCWAIASTSGKAAQKGCDLLARPGRTESDLLHDETCLFGEIGEPLRRISFAYVSPIFDLPKRSGIASIHWDILFIWGSKEQSATWSKDACERLHEFYVIDYVFDGLKACCNVKAFFEVISATYRSSVLHLKPGIAAAFCCSPHRLFEVRTFPPNS